jgi:hypothetical protein
VSGIDQQAVIQGQQLLDQGVVHVIRQSTRGFDSNEIGTSDITHKEGITG